MHEVIPFSNSLTYKAVYDLIIHTSLVPRLWEEGKSGLVPIVCTCINISGGIHRKFICSDCATEIQYNRSDFECVVKRLRMVLYKPDCNSNDCKLQSGQATPSTLAKGVAACGAYHICKIEQDG